MKKFEIFCVLATALLFTSCKEACYECSIASGGFGLDADICEGKVCIGTLCNDLPSGTSNKEYAEQLESGGYTCNKK